MKLSTQATKYINEQYGSAGDPAPNGVDELVKTIGAQLAAVEETSDFGARFKDVVVVKVVSCAPHADSDHLVICKINDGHKIDDVERDADGHIQIVTGASNLRPGFMAAWLPPNTAVPESLTPGKEPFVLSARPMRGQLSYGMLASARELTLGDDHTGILEIDEELGPIEPGTMFVDAFHLRGDVIIDMENKMFTHRPDCFGWLGLARELEGIQHRPYKSPEWYKLEADLPSSSASVTMPIAVQNDIPELVPRFMAIVLRDVTVKPSPIWLQLDLARAGLRPINNIVDYTNFYMLLTGQPLHAYDYDKVKARADGGSATLVVRHPKPGEKIKLLNGKEIEPRAEAIMIATPQELIGVGGVMGGADTEVDDSTKHIILEAATFDMYSIRRTSMAHGLFTDAVTRFNKGQSPLQNRPVVCKIVDQICQFANGKIEGLFDDNHLSKEVMQRGNIHAPVTVSTKFVNDRLGWNLSAEEMSKLLTNVEFTVQVNGDDLTVTAPFWRTDIEIPEDVVEEIGRLNGFDKLPLDLPRRDLTPASKNQMFTIKSKLRQQLASFGANEVLTYSFVHGNLLDKVGQTQDEAFQLSNALSPDLQYFRLSLTPSLLDLVHPNLKAGHDKFALFELGKAHNKKEPDSEGLPREVNALAFVIAAKEQPAQAPYYEARNYLMQLLDAFGASQLLSFGPLEGADLYNNPWIIQMTAPYVPNRSAVLRDAEGLIWGVVGEFKPAVRRQLKLPAYVAGFEIDPLLFLQPGAKRSYTQLSKFPSLEQDLCLKVDAKSTYQEVRDFVWHELQNLQPEQTASKLSPVDIYQRQDDSAHKQITLRISLTNYDRTLTDQEVSKLLDQIAKAAADKLGAERI